MTTNARYAPGLRLQIIVALTLVMVLAFVPLYFAVASLTRVTLLSARDESARSLGRAVAAHVADVRSSSALTSVLGSHVGRGGVDAICVYDARGAKVACAGDPQEVASFSPLSPPFGESVTTVRGREGRALDVAVPDSLGSVVVRIKTDERSDRSAPLVRLVAGYMLVFALALVFSVYVALTRLIVRPVEALSRSADKVANGSRPSELTKLANGRWGALELEQLSSSLELMTTRLVREENDLRKKVAELVLAQEELKQAQMQLIRSERLAGVGRLAAGLAHEIGNPVTAIMGIEDLLLAGDLSKEEHDDFLKRMRKETERIHFILRDLLAFSRPEEGLLEAGAATCDVTSVVSDALALVKPQKTFKNITIVSEIPSAKLIARIPAHRLSQVLLNVLLNAGDALEDASDARVSLRVRESAPWIEVEIEDNGPGVADDVKDRIFEPFVTTKEVGKGTGLGLAVCLGIVEAEGGTITYDDGAQANATPGARFVIRLVAG